MDDHKTTKPTDATSTNEVEERLKEYLKGRGENIDELSELLLYILATHKTALEIYNTALKGREPLKDKEAREEQEEAEAELRNMTATELLSIILNIVDGNNIQLELDAHKLIQAILKYRAGQKYSNMLQGKGLNELAHVSKRGMGIDLFSGEGTIIKDSVKITMENANINRLDVSTQQVMDAFTIKLTSDFPYGVNASADQIDKHRGITWTVKDFAEWRGIKDLKEARKQLENGVLSLYGLSLEFDAELILVPEGKSRKKRMKMHHQMRIADHIATPEEKEKIIKNGVVCFKFSFDAAKYLSKIQIMPYPEALLKINGKLNPHSYYLGRKLCEHHNMNIAKPNANRISVKALTDACPDLPTYESVKEGARQITKRIIEPFERDLDALRDDYEILRKWEYCNKDGKPLTDEQLEAYNYDAWINWLVQFKLSCYPDQTERLEEIEQRKAIAEERRKKAAKAGKKRNRRKSKAPEASGTN